ncbi:hypothetical protein [Aquimarina sp. I32.4]|uniref:hypothetical protein n=1 Tax=Aquimarina sp. I32.4 TaxID=2053903 RepID=UPI0011AECDD8|nr:hypothetical protein [Aquimarina sp. I32.4]
MRIDTYINTILKNVKHPTDEEVYFLSTRATKSTYNIQINDIPVEQSFGYQKDNRQRIFQDFHSINSTLNSNGEQKVDISIYPYNRDTFQSNDRIKIIIEKMDKSGNLNDYFEFKPKMLEDGETPEYVGKSEYKGSFMFEAKLPYQKEIDWFSSENLIDQKNIEQEVVEAYKEVMRLYAEGDMETLLELYKSIFQAEAQSVYATKEKQHRLNYKLNIKRIHPFFYKSKPNLVKDYELKFYADGKLVTLEKKKDSSRAYNESALSITYDKDFDKFPDGLDVSVKHLEMFEEGTTPKMEMELYLFFYKPKGSKTLKLATDIFREEKLLNSID